jgi:peptidoglycan/xylan/chitin deacetylase (PgdA/CDA1 family)
MLIAINYHYIRESFDASFPSIFGITPSKFRSQLENLAQFGSFVSQNDIINSINGKKDLPEFSFIVTFDDGLAEQYDLALPILEQLGIPAIFFVNTRVFTENHVLGVHKIHQLRSVINPTELKSYVEAFISSSGKQQVLIAYEAKAVAHYKYDDVENAKLKYLLNFVLDLNQREALINQKFSEVFGSEEKINSELYMKVDHLHVLHSKGLLGSHSHEHYPIGTLDTAKQEYQINKSQEEFEKLIGKRIRSFSYPYGALEACQNLASKLENAGFEFALTMERAVNADLKNPFYLSRFDNNDMPLGKAWKYGDQNPFNALSLASLEFDNI